MTKSLLHAQLWLCRILTGLSLSSVTLLNLPLAALFQNDCEGRERFIAFESRQLKDAERIIQFTKRRHFSKYALVKFIVHRVGSKPFVVYTDHASLRTETQSPHLSQRMAR